MSEFETPDQQSPQSYPEILSNPEQFAGLDRRAHPDLGFTYSNDDTHELSGLPNRKALTEAMQNAVGDADLQSNFALVFVDLDGMKEVNDEHGHDEGDDYLRNAAGVLHEITRPDDAQTLVTHLGGDEYAVLFAGITSEDALDSVTERLQTALDELGIPNSMGAVLHDGEQTPQEMLKTADELMYADKIERKTADLTEEQRRRYLELGNFAIEHGLRLRDAPIIIEALNRFNS